MIKRKRHAISGFLFEILIPPLIDTFVLSLRDRFLKNKTIHCIKIINI